MTPKKVIVVTGTVDEATKALILSENGPIGTNLAPGQKMSDVQIIFQDESDMSIPAMAAALMGGLGDVPPGMFPGMSQMPNFIGGLPEMPDLDGPDWDQPQIMENPFMSCAEEADAAQLAGQFAALEAEKYHFQEAVCQRNHFIESVVNDANMAAEEAQATGREIDSLEQQLAEANEKVRAAEDRANQLAQTTAQMERAFMESGVVEATGKQGKPALLSAIADLRQNWPIDAGGRTTH